MIKQTLLKLRHISASTRELQYTKKFYTSQDQRFSFLCELFNREPGLYEDLLVRFSKTWSSALLHSVVHKACMVKRIKARVR